MRASASVSYQRAAEDVKYATGIEVPKSVQQRLVHRQNFEFPEAQSMVEELSVDGGNIRIRTPIGKPCDWKGYKAARLHNLQAIAKRCCKQIAASFQENSLVIGSTTSFWLLLSHVLETDMTEYGTLFASLHLNKSDAKYLTGSISWKTFIK